MRPSMRLLVLATALAVLAGCGGDSETANEQPTEPASESTTTTEEPEVPLAESCPQVEAGLPKGFVPPASKWQEYEVELQAIVDAGDLETQNALDGLQQAVARLAEDPANGGPFVNAHQALIDALDSVAIRCKAVGSSALQ